MEGRVHPVRGPRTARSTATWSVVRGAAARRMALGSVIAPRPPALALSRHPGDTRARRARNNETFRQDRDGPRSLLACATSPIHSSYSGSRSIDGSPAPSDRPRAKSARRCRTNPRIFSGIAPTRSRDSQRLAGNQSVSPQRTVSGRPTESEGRIRSGVPARGKSSTGARSNMLESSGWKRTTNHSKPTYSPASKTYKSPGTGVSCPMDGPACSASFRAASAIALRIRSAAPGVAIVSSLVNFGLLFTICSLLLS